MIDIYFTVCHQSSRVQDSRKDDMERDSKVNRAPMRGHGVMCCTDSLTTSIAGMTLGWSGQLTDRCVVDARTLACTMGNCCSHQTFPREIKETHSASG